MVLPTSSPILAIVLKPLWSTGIPLTLNQACCNCPLAEEAEVQGSTENCTSRPLTPRLNLLYSNTIFALGNLMMNLLSAIFLADHFQCSLLTTDLNSFSSCLEVRSPLLTVMIAVLDFSLEVLGSMFSSI